MNTREDPSDGGASEIADDLPITEGRQGLGIGLAVPAGLEPATSAFEARRSIQLSYGTVSIAEWQESLPQSSLHNIP